MPFEYRNRIPSPISPFAPLLMSICHSDLNVLIMNYLVHQGYPSAAVSFAQEANLALSKESVESITARMEIRNKIHAGDIEGAIHDINTLNPSVLIIPDLCTALSSLLSSLIFPAFRRSILLAVIFSFPFRPLFHCLVDTMCSTYFCYSCLITTPPYIFHYYACN